MARADWQAALPDHACALQQSWQFGAAAAAMGRQVQRAELLLDGQRGLVQMICRRLGPLNIAYLARGPIWDDPTRHSSEALRLIRQTVPGRAALMLCAPELNEPALLPLMTAPYMAELRLTDDPTTMRRAMHGKWRNRLVRAEKKGVTVDASTPNRSALDCIIDKDRAQRRARGYRSLPPAFLHAWQRTGRSGMRLYQAQSHGETLAAMLFLDHAPGVTYQIGWTSDAGRAASAHHLILWTAMQDFAGKGRKRLDLGPLDTVATPGLARFKLGAGAQARVLGTSGPCLPGMPGWPWQNTAGQPRGIRSHFPGVRAFLTRNLRND